VHGGPHTRAGGCLKKAVALWKSTLEHAPDRTCGPVERGAHAAADLSSGLVTPWGSQAGPVLFLKD